jgi:hypothetical protein
VFEDLLRHPGFTYMAFSAFAVAIIWMIYRTKRDQEQTDIMYAQMDLLWKIWGDK